MSKDIIKLNGQEYALSPVEKKNEVLMSVTEDGDNFNIQVNKRMVMPILKSQGVREYIKNFFKRS